MNFLTYLLSIPLFLILYLFLRTYYNVFVIFLYETQTLSYFCKNTINKLDGETGIIFTGI
jgi:hypothetical protein